jgi:hypothetical protein
MWKCLGAGFMLNNEPALALCAYETARALGFTDGEGLEKAMKEAKEKLGSASYDSKQAKACIDQRVDDLYKQLRAEVERAEAREKQRQADAEQKKVAAKPAKAAAAKPAKKAAAKPAAGKPAKAPATKPAGKMKK